MNIARYFDLTINDPPRTMAKKQWRDNQHWLRSCRRKIHTEMENAARDVIICSGKGISKVFIDEANHIPINQVIDTEVKA